MTPVPDQTPPSEAPVPEGQPSQRRRIGLYLGIAALLGMVLLPPPDGLSTAGWRAAAVGVLMAVWWVTEAIPIPATALIPLILFPLLGILPVDAAAAPVDRMAVRAQDALAASIHPAHTAHDGDVAFVVRVTGGPPADPVHVTEGAFWAARGAIRVAVGLE